MYNRRLRSARSPSPVQTTKLLREKRDFLMSSDSSKHSSYIDISKSLSISNLLKRLKNPNLKYLVAKRMWKK